MALRDGDALLGRQKELQCLYRIAELTEDLDGENPSVAVGSAALPSLPSAQMLQHCVDVLPASWQWPSAARARIDIGEVGRFDAAAGSGVDPNAPMPVDGPWVLSRPILVEGMEAGRVCVAYDEASAIAAGADPGMPFLDEERALLDAVAQKIGRFMERKKNRYALRERMKELHCVMEVSTLVEDPVSPVRQDSAERTVSEFRNEMRCVA